ncbi:site-specific integrase, partial [Agromyces binzhouensis]
MADPAEGGPSGTRMRTAVRPTRMDDAVDAYLGHVRLERGYSEHTVAAYASDLADLTRFAEARSVDGVDGVDLDLLRDWLWEATERGLARATVARRAASARGLCAWLER